MFENFLKQGKEPEQIQKQIVIPFQKKNCKEKALNFGSPNIMH